jgi:hypothetical protein
VDIVGIFLAVDSTGQNLTSFLEFPDRFEPGKPFLFTRASSGIIPANSIVEVIKPWKK